MRQVYTTGGPGFNRFNGGITPVVKNLLIITIAVYFIQQLLDKSLHQVLVGGVAWQGKFSFLFGLSLEGLKHGMVWQFITYIFLHGPPFHLIFNMMMLFFIGPETERAMGPRHFLALYFISGFLGGLGWLLMGQFGLCLGSSGSLFGILVGFATLFPHRPLMIIILMITLKAWVMVSLIILIELIMMVGRTGGSVAHSAHLAGALAGYIYISIIFVPNRRKWSQWIRSLSQPKLQVLKPEKSEGPTATDIDQVLDKIARHGIQSLSSKERKILEEASRRR